jgi:hypothetical protein
VNYCSVSYAFAAHDLRVNDHPNTTRYRLEFGDVMAIDATNNKNTGATEFKARPALTLSPEQFNRFIRILEMLQGQSIRAYIK